MSPQRAQSISCGASGVRDLHGVRLAVPRNHESVQAFHQNSAGAEMLPGYAFLNIETTPKTSRAKKAKLGGAQILNADRNIGWKSCEGTEDYTAKDVGWCFRCQAKKVNIPGENKARQSAP